MHSSRYALSTTQAAALNPEPRPVPPLLPSPSQKHLVRFLIMQTPRRHGGGSRIRSQTLLFLSPGTTRLLPRLIVGSSGESWIRAELTTFRLRSCRAERERFSAPAPPPPPGWSAGPHADCITGRGLHCARKSRTRTRLWIGNTCTGRAATVT